MPSMTTVPSIRIRKENDEPLRPEGKYVLYWMTAFRRLGWNFALQHAADLAREMGKPLVILDALEVDYPYASPRFHRFILDGMAERARALISTPVFHYAFIEREPSEARGLLPALARDACCVVGDEYPSFFLPRLMQKAGRELPVQFELVDSNGILPLRAGDRIFSGAYPFRRFLQKTLMDHLGQPPAPDPLSKSLPDAPHAVEQEVLDRWAPLALADLDDLRTGLGRLPLDLSVAITTTPGGTIPARNRLFPDPG